MTAMLILDAIGMALIATAIVSAMAWAIMTSHRQTARPAWVRSRTRRHVARGQLSRVLRPGAPAGLLD